jgi:hypothetical protein
MKKELRMDDQFTLYLQSLGMGSVFIESIYRFYNCFLQIADEQATDLFVSEYVNDDGQRQFMGVCFFSDNFVYEVEDFVSDTPKMWIAKLTNNIAFIGLHAKNYDFKNATLASRLILDSSWLQGTTFGLTGKASGDNCTHLLEIVRKYLKPNLK